MKERLIWSNLDIFYDEWVEDFKDSCEANGIDENEKDLYEWVDECLSDYLDDERVNLNKEVDGVIVCFADLGLWDGHHQGARIFGTNVKNILYSDCDYTSWYCDRWNVHCTAAHHDGRNHYLYRVAKDMDTAKRLAEKIAYEGMTEQQFMKATKSLRPYVARVYGWD